MKFLEALKTGRPFRIRGKTEWIDAKLDPSQIMISGMDAISDAWEVKSDLIVFETQWVPANLGHERVAIPMSAPTQELIGKRTLVTVKVLE